MQQFAAYQSLDVVIVTQIYLPFCLKLLVTSIHHVIKKADMFEVQSV